MSAARSNAAAAAAQGVATDQVVRLSAALDVSERIIGGAAMDLLRALWTNHRNEHEVT